MVKFIVILDVGTTNLKCHLFTEQLKSIIEKCSKIEIFHTTDGSAEINPDVLWKSIVSIVNECLEEAGINAKQVACLGISTHRGSFITWDRSTGIPYHNFISWKDLRAKHEIKRLNNNFGFKIFKWLTYLLYLITDNPRYLTASSHKFTDVQVTGRLLWVAKNNILLKRAIQNGQAMFGTLDTWLLYRLTSGQTYSTDISMASSTGMFDPFSLTWSKLMKFMGMPNLSMPNVCETAGCHFGETSPSIWGTAIPITCAISDQAAALYGSKCFNPGELKLTLGTGAFLDVNVGCKAKASKAGLYPLVCWKYQDQLAYALEATCHDCGTIISWLITSGFCNNIEELSIIVKSVHDTEGVYFIPAFSGLQIPFDDPTTGTGFIGINRNTKKTHLIRAVLEAIVFRLYDLFLLCKSEVNTVSDHPIKVNGGVSNNDFICQSLANICNQTVSRPKNTEMSICGVALLAGQVIGIRNHELGVEYDNSFRMFMPLEADGFVLRCKYTEWRKAVCKFLSWRE